MGKGAGDGMGSCVGTTFAYALIARVLLVAIRSGGGILELLYVSPCMPMAPAHAASGPC